MGSASGKADRRMSQVTQRSLFTNILPMSLRVLLSHPIITNYIKQLKAKSSHGVTWTDHDEVKAN